jgi:putative inorganic carbon (hco3(-)) transporter
VNRALRSAGLLPPLVVLLLSLWGAALVIVLLSAGKLYSLPLLLATIFPLALYASRNPRLFFLMGMVGTAALGLSINFNRHVHIGGAPSYSIDAMDLFMVPLLVFMVRDFAVGYRNEIRLSWISAWWLGLMALGMWNVVAGPYREFAAFEVFRMFKCWLLFLVIINECVRERHFHHVLLALAAGLVLNIAIALLQFTLKRSLGLEALGEPAPEAILGANYGVYLGAGAVYRVSGLVGHPNLFAAYLAMLLPIYIGLLFTDTKWSTKAMVAVLAGFGLLALLLTLSRTGWAAFAAAVLALGAVVVMHPTLRTQHVKLKATMAMLLAVGAVVAAGPIINRLTHSDSGALDFRYEWLGVAWKMVLDKPVLGHGLNTFTYQIVDFSPYSVGKMMELFGPVWPVVHNTYFLVWSEQGTVGLFLFLALHVHVIWLAFRNGRYMHSSSISMTSVGAVCGVVAIMVDGMGSFFQRVPAPDRIFWIVVGLIVAAHYWNLANDPLRRRLGRPALQPI